MTRASHPQWSSPRRATAEDARGVIGQAARTAVTATIGLPVPSWKTAKRAAGAVVLSAVALLVLMASMFGMSESRAEAGNENASDIPPAVLKAYQDAGDGSDVPWAVLAGIGYVQTNHGRTAPGEAIQRADPGDPPPAPAPGTATGANAPHPEPGAHLSPTLTPPITQPGWGLFLAKTADTFHDPQDIEQSSQQLADLLAEAVTRRASAENVDEAEAFSVLAPDSAGRSIDPKVWAVWVGAIGDLPLTPAGGGSHDLGQVAMTRAAFYADFQAPIPAAGSTGQVGVAVPYADELNAAAAQYRIDPRMLAAVAKAESGFDPATIDCRTASSAGAQGLMQIMPDTARAWSVNACDPRQAIPAAARELRRLFDRFGAWSLAWAAYNAGEGAVEQFGGIPPYSETQTYVSRIQQYWDEYRATFPDQLPTGGAPAVSDCRDPSFDGVLTAAPSDHARGALRAACSQMGVPYVWGGESPGVGFDCSGLTQWAYAQAGVAIGRVVREQWDDGDAVPSLDQALPGDLIVLDGGDHIGIYIGNRQMIHAPHTGEVVSISTVWATPTTIRRLP